jgi:hypothetical protein
MQGVWGDAGPAAGFSASVPALPAGIDAEGDLVVSVCGVREPLGGPEPSTVKEWVRSFGYGAGYLLLDVLRRFVMSLYPESELSGRAPPELERSSNGEQLKSSYHFCRYGEILYARKKEVEPKMSFSDTDFFPFLVRWLQTQSIAPRMFWSPCLETTPTTPF